MGTWSHEPFGNDTACDWAYGLDEHDGLELIESTIDRALSECDEYLEAPSGEEAIAAIEVVAKILGKGTQEDSYTESIDEWVKKVNVKPSDELVSKINKLIPMLTSEKSELTELWEEADDFNDWKDSIDQLSKAINT